MYECRRARSLAVALLAVVGSLALAGGAHAEVAKCKAAIIKASAAYAQARSKALQKCKDGVVKDKITPFTIDCTAEPKAAAAIIKAQDKLKTSIDKGCGGKDKACGGDLTDEDGGTAIAFTSCPNIGSTICSGNTIGTTDCTGITACLQCIDDAAVNDAIKIAYGDLVDTDAKSKDKTVKAINKCQGAIGKAAAAFLAAKSKALSKCWEGVTKGKANVPCPVPGDGKAATAIGAAISKLADGVKKACAGKDKVFGGADVNADFTPDQIGFAASCPAVDPPGSLGPCGSLTVTDLQGIVSCITCVSEFDVDCADRAAASTLDTYPFQCVPGPTPTPTPSTTHTPTPSPTSTPGVCGDNQVQAGEFCDGTGTGGACGPNFPCNGSCTCDCPSTVHFAGDPTDPATILDTGWTGIAHRAPVISNGDVTVTLSNCDGNQRPCGVCDITGPIANVGASELRNQRCTGDTSVQCTNAPGGTGGVCTGLGTCEFFFGAPLPLVAGGVGTCVENIFNGAVTGTANVETGEASTTANLTSKVHAAVISTDTPCPVCEGDATRNDNVKGGTCNGGPRDGLTCDGNGTVPGRGDFGVTSFDCPPPASTIAVLPIDLSNSTGNVTKAVTSSSPNCSAGNLPPGTKCVCDTCNNINQQPCDSNADCPASGGNPGRCGGPRCIGGANAGSPCTVASQCPGGACARPGEPTKPNGCVDNSQTPNVNGSLCVDTAPVGDNEGECPEGPPTGTCSLASGHPQRSCLSDSGCCDDATCTTDPVTPGDCQVSNRLCFLDNGLGGSIVGSGMADPPVEDVAHPTLAAIFCIGPTSAPAVNIAAGLPGPGRVTIKGTAEGLP